MLGHHILIASHMYRDGRIDMLFTPLYVFSFVRRKLPCCIFQLLGPRDWTDYWTPPLLGIWMFPYRRCRSNQMASFKSRRMELWIWWKQTRWTFLSWIILHKTWALEESRMFLTRQSWLTQLCWGTHSVLTRPKKLSKNYCPRRVHLSSKIIHCNQQTVVSSHHYFKQTQTVLAA